MTGKIINLRTRRKRKAREDARTEADARSLKHGLSRAERELAEARNALEARRLDGTRRTTDDDD